MDVVKELKEKGYVDNRLYPPPQTDDKQTIKEKKKEIAINNIDNSYFLNSYDTKIISELTELIDIVTENIKLRIKHENKELNNENFDVENNIQNLNNLIKLINEKNKLSKF
jgi:hypothetical protein